MKGVQNGEHLNFYWNHKCLVNFADLHPAEIRHFHLSARILSGDRKKRPGRTDRIEKKEIVMI